MGPGGSGRPFPGVPGRGAGDLPLEPGAGSRAGGGLGVALGCPWCGVGCRGAAPGSSRVSPVPRVVPANSNTLLLFFFFPRSGPQLEEEAGEAFGGFAAGGFRL